MLAATRETSIHSGAQPASPAATGFARFMAVLQVAGSLLTIPLGLASGYSIYHANFSTEARCQGLRTNIVSMLDKSADASTLRVLVRRDVATFERSCGTVDPDAVTAFRTLLSANKPVATAVLAHPVAKKAVAKLATAKSVEVKPAVAKRATREASDAKWLAAVRAALVSHHAEPARPVDLARTALKVARPAAPAAASMQTPVAPVPPAPVNSRARVAADHPVPPALIPESSTAPATETASNIRIGTLLKYVPLIGGMFER